MIDDEIEQTDNPIEEMPANYFGSASGNLITVDRELLRRALNQLRATVGGMGSIKGYVLLEAENGVLSLKAANDISGMELKIAASIMGKKSVALPYSLFREFVSQMREKTLTIDVLDENYTAIINGDQEIRGLSPSHFIVFPEPQQVVGVFSMDELRAALRASMPFVAKPDAPAPPITKGVCFRFLGDGQLQLIGLDGYRYGEYFIRKGADWKGDLVVPIQSARLMSSITQVGDAVLSTHKANVMMLSIDPYFIMTLLMDGPYPDFRQRFIGQEAITTITIDKAELISATRLAMLVNTEEAKRINFEVINGVVVVESGAQERGSVRKEIDAQITGPGQSIWIDARFLLANLSALSSSQVEIRLRDTRSPVIICDSTDNALTFVLPMAPPQPSPPIGVLVVNAA